MAQPLRALVIDDDPHMRMLIRIGLECEGFDVEEAVDGSAAQERMLAGLALDVVLVDLMMPGMDGLRFLHWLRSTRGDELPVLAVTAVSDAETERTTLEAGATRILHKPIDLETLVSEVRALLAS